MCYYHVSKTPITIPVLLPKMGGSRHSGEDPRAVNKPQVWLATTPPDDDKWGQYLYEVVIEPDDPDLLRDEPFAATIEAIGSDRPYFWHFSPVPRSFRQVSLWDASAQSWDPTIVCHKAKGGGNQSSSLTRVQPAFLELWASYQSGGWVERLLELGSRHKALERLPAGRTGGLRKMVFEHPCLAPLDYLQWLVANGDQLDVGKLRSQKEPTLGKRKLLLGGDAATVEEAEAKLLESREPGKDQWHVLEGKTEVDCALFLDSVTVFIEGKRNEPLSERTEWFAKRHQIARNLDCLRDLAKTDQWYVMTIVEAGKKAEQEAKDLDTNRKTMTAALPHLSEEQVDDLLTHYLGYTTWQRLQFEFGLTDYPETVEQMRSFESASQ